VREYQSLAEKGYVNGLCNAEAKGMAAAEDFSITERDCPYSRYEHRMSWLEGFRHRRRQLPPPPSRPEPDFE
jgi:ribosome modulation factor